MALKHDFMSPSERVGICYIGPMKKALETTGAVLSAIAISGCAQPRATAPAAPMVGMANPASVYCAQLGGKTRIEKTGAGERGICVLPDGREIDEWELFRRDHPSR